MWYDWQPKPQIDYHTLEEICPVGEYRVVSPDRIPSGIFSPALSAKAHSILVVCSGTSSGRIYFMFESTAKTRGQNSSKLTPPQNGQTLI